MTEDPNSARAAMRARVYEYARKSLIDYMQLIFSEAVPSGEFLPANHTKLLARTFERVASGEVKRLLVAIPPRFGKSFAGSVALPTWLLGRDPSLKIICASYGDELSRDFAVQSRKIMQSPLYRALFPKTQIAADGGALHRLETTAGGYRRATSVDGSVTGKGADIIIVDDPLKAKDAVVSEAARNEAHGWITNTLMSRFDKPADGRMIVISQRLHTEDLIGKLRDDGGWTMLSVPAEALKPMSFDIGEKERWQLEPGDLLYPERFDHAALEQLKLDLGEAAYAAQILQDPKALGGNIFKLKDFRPIPEVKLPYDYFEAKYQSWDTAISEEATAAWSVCTTWGVRGKSFVLLDVFRERLSYPQLLKAVRAQYAKHKPKTVIVEKASSGIALIQQLSQEGVTWLEWMPPKGSKIERAMHQAPKIEAGRVFYVADQPWEATFFNEIAAFPMGRNDQVDSMTQFLRAFDLGRNHQAFWELSYWKEEREKQGY
ncbi:phage terminase large subunit [Sphingomonas sp. TZW2008]|uniref:phage terminase large subunit n=1 Tax=Sphingomonas sp. TZW2008 TaxID=1917973 RepID=UPI000A268075|nr:phage terminase large subunit [Sphingomonas sp. TZW2008]